MVVNLISLYFTESSHLALMGHHPLHERFDVVLVDREEVVVHRIPLEPKPISKLWRPVTTIDVTAHVLALIAALFTSNVAKINEIRVGLLLSHTITTSTRAILNKHIPSELVDLTFPPVSERDGAPSDPHTINVAKGSTQPQSQIEVKIFLFGGILLLVKRMYEIQQDSSHGFLLMGVHVDYSRTERRMMVLNW